MQRKSPNCRTRQNRADVRLKKHRASLAYAERIGDRGAAARHAERVAHFEKVVNNAG